MMGDHADDMLDAYLAGDYDEQEQPDEIRCRDCHSEDVYWVQLRDGRWVLYDFKSSRKHQCDDKVLTNQRLAAFSEEDE